MTFRLHDQRPCRRHFLKIGTIPLMGLQLSKLLASESSQSSEASAKSIILVWLDGGPSTIDMWDLKPDAKAEIRGEFRPISTAADGVLICEHLPHMAKQMDHCTLIRSVSHTIAEHGQGAEHVLTGNPISPALRYPSIGSIVSSQAIADSSREVPAYMDLTTKNIGQAGYLGSSHNPFVVDRFLDRSLSDSKDEFAIADGLSIADLTRRRELLDKVEQGFRQFDKTSRADEMSTFQQRALDILTSGRTRDALDVQKESSAVRELYGQSPLGLSALAARRLVQAGVRFVTIGMSGWDTHDQNFSRLRNNQLPQLDRALAALIGDLEAQGLLNETIVYCAGEFGRTPGINGQGGRDHWAQTMSVLIAGGNFKPAFVYGSTDKSGLYPETGTCSPADINATLINQIGIRPETKLATRTGRPMPLFREARVLQELRHD